MKAEESSRAGLKLNLRQLWLILPGTAALCFLAALLSPYFRQHRHPRPLSPCEENQSKIDGALQQYMLENDGPLPERLALSDLVGSANYLRQTPLCPAGGTYETLPLDREATAPLVRCSLPDHPFPE